MSTDSSYCESVYFHTGSYKVNLELCFQMFKPILWLSPHYLEVGKTNIWQSLLTLTRWLTSIRLKLEEMSHLQSVLMLWDEQECLNISTENIRKDIVGLNNLSLLLLLLLMLLIIIFHQIFFKVKFYKFLANVTLSNTNLCTNCDNIKKDFQFLLCRSNFLFLLSNYAAG